MGASVTSSLSSLQSVKTKPQNSKDTVRIGILGASGYTGAEVYILNFIHFKKDSFLVMLHLLVWWLL